MQKIANEFHRGPRGDGDEECTNCEGRCDGNSHRKTKSPNVEFHNAPPGRKHFKSISAEVLKNSDRFHATDYQDSLLCLFHSLLHSFRHLLHHSRHVAHHLRHVLHFFRGHLAATHHLPHVSHHPRHFPHRVFHSLHVLAFHHPLTFHHATHPLVH